MQTLILSLILGGAILIVLIWVITLELRLRRVFRGSNATSLEKLIEKNQSDIAKLYAENTALRGEIARLDGRLRKKIETARTIRFNPFQGTGVGGNQSFASAFLDEEGNGVVLSTLYSREKVSIFGKPVTARTSEYELTDEEKSVLSS